MVPTSAFKLDRLSTSLNEYFESILSMDEFQLAEMVKRMEKTGSRFLEVLDDPDDEDAKRTRRAQDLKTALDKCFLGDIGAKTIVKGYILEFLMNSLKIKEEGLTEIIKFSDHDSLSPMDKFQIICYLYELDYKEKALTQMIKDYEIDQLKKTPIGWMFVFDTPTMNKIYAERIRELSYLEKMEILTQKLYETTKGLFAIDIIRDMDIDGISVGVSGVAEEYMANMEILANKDDLLAEAKFYKSYESVWLYFQGKEIFFDFLTFESFENLSTTTTNVISFGNKGQFSRDRGYIINTSADNSRVVGFRPDFAESWAFFIRKLGGIRPLEDLVVGKHAEKVIAIEEYMAKAIVKMVITGQQGDGKSTHLLAFLQRMYPMHPVRVWETNFEMLARIKLLGRNILTFQEIDALDPEKALDVIKKTNGVLTVVGEAAEDREVSFLIKIAQVGSRGSATTHHAYTPPGLIRAFRNSGISAGLFRDEKVAEEQALQIVQFNLHLGKTVTGVRNVYRITEFMPLDEENDLIDSDLSNCKTIKEKFSKLMDIMYLYIKYKMINKTYSYHNIVEYDSEKNEFTFPNPISKARMKHIYENLVDEDRDGFKSLMIELYGKQTIWNSH